MWKKPLKWALLAFLLLYVGAMFVWAREEARRHICQEIEIEIDGKGQVASISPQSVMEVLQGYPGNMKGAPINSINTLDISNYLRKFNNFESVDCIITTQGKLKIRVVPMMPEMRVFDGVNGYYVNKDGKTMAALPGFHVDVPLVYGKFDKNLRPESVLPVVRFVRQDSLLRQLTSMIVVNDRENILLIPRIKGHVINIGDVTRLPEKRDAIYTAYKNILPYKGWETYDTISVKFKGQIIATRRDKTPRYPAYLLEEEEDLEEAALQSAMESVQEGENPEKKENAAAQEPNNSGQQKQPAKPEKPENAVKPEKEKTEKPPAQNKPAAPEQKKKV